MKCNLCGGRMMRAKTDFKASLQKADKERVDLWVCTNKDCDMYSGRDLDHPEHSTEKE